MRQVVASVLSLGIAYGAERALPIAWKGEKRAVPVDYLFSIGWGRTIARQMESRQARSG